MKLNLLLISGLFVVASAITAQSTITYIESGDVFANPERGMHKYTITDANYYSTSGYTNLNQSTLESWKAGDDKVTIVLRLFLLDNFLNSDISSTYLSNIQNDFNVIRASGFKCIVRFYYSNAHSSSAQQPTKSRILAHINQLAPLLEANKDVIYSHQAGFLGTWGEWYYTNSDEFGTDGSVSSTQWANRKAIIDAMLAATPTSVPVLVRYPKIKQTMYGSSPLSGNTAYLNTPIARIGFYNDAFLNFYGDLGTFTGVSQYGNPVGSSDYVYLSNETKYTPMVGETCGINSPRTDGSNAISEMNATHWTSLNRDYYSQNISNWIASGHYPEILRRLGYRFVLKNGSFNLSGSLLTLNIVIQNVGFARLVKPRNAFLVLRNSDNGDKYSFSINTDPRTWEGQFNVSQTVNISSIPNGDYTAHLHLPDPSPGLAGRSAYSIRFANNYVWDSSQGYNDLNFSFTKSSTVSPGGGNCPSVDVIIDGTVNEWGPIDIYSQIDSETIKVYNDQDYVYFMFSGNSNSFSHYQLYLDTNNGSSGFTSHSWTGLASNLFIENGGLHQYTGSGTDWSWNNLGNLTSIVNNGKVEVRMPISYFSGNGFKAGLRILNSSWQVQSSLPDQHDVSEYLICNPSSCPSIDVNIDGNLNEWAAIDSYAQLGGESLKVYDDKDYVYFSFSGNSFSHYQFYLDTNNGSSRFTSHSWTGLAANLFIENGGLHQYTGSGTNWSWNSLGNITSIVNNGKVEVRIPRSYFSGNGFKAGFRSLDSNWQVQSFLPGQQGVTDYELCNAALKSGVSYSNEHLDATSFTEKVQVYPNPVKDVINIVNVDSVLDVSLFSVDGVLHKTFSPVDCISGVCQMSVSDIPVGIYFLVVETSQETKTFKIIKL